MYKSSVPYGPILIQESSGYVYDASFASFVLPDHLTKLPSQGCYVDSVNMRVMDRQIVANSNMTVPRCVAEGKNLSFAYIGLEYVRSELTGLYQL